MFDFGEELQDRIERIVLEGAWMASPLTDKSKDISLDVHPQRGGIVIPD